jgi:O-antigen ligase
LAWLALPVVVVALVGSYTRTAWIGVIFGLLVIGAVRYRPLLFLVPVVAIGLAVAVPSTSQRFSDVSHGPISATRPGNSLRARFDLWKENLPKAKKDPVIGLGFGAITKDEGIHVHSDYVRAVVETGVFGLIFYVWLLVSAVRGALRARRSAAAARDQTGLLIALGALAASALYMVMSGDSNLMTQVAVAAPFWGYMAIAHAVGANDDELLGAT